MSNAHPLAPTDTFVHRHLGPSPAEVQAMLTTLGVASLDALVESTVPADIRLAGGLDIGPAGYYSQ